VLVPAALVVGHGLLVGAAPGEGVVDGLGEELKIPGRKFGFKRLIAAQAAGDFEALKERGRRVARVRLDES
jgi:hypothetical protein